MMDPTVLLLVHILIGVFSGAATVVFFTALKTHREHLASPPAKHKRVWTLGDDGELSERKER